MRIVQPHHRVKVSYNDDEFPVDPRQQRAVFQDHFVGCADHRELIRGSPPFHVAHDGVLEDVGALFWLTMIHDDGNTRHPHGKLVHPVG